MFRITANHCDESKAENNSNKDDFSAREPEFAFSIPLDSEEVDKTGYILASSPAKAKKYVYRV